MTYEKIEQLERDNAQLKQAVKYFMGIAFYAAKPEDAVARMRKQAAEYLEKAEMLERMLPLLKD